MSSPLDDLRGVLLGALREGLAALDPARLVHAALPSLPPKRARVIVIAAGKAAQAMTAGAFACWPGRIEHALVVGAAPAMQGVGLPGSVDQRVCAHPIPDERSVAAADEALRLAATLGPSDLLLALVSGGASALLAAPPDGLDLAGKQAVVAGLLDRGVPIRDVNLVRRHLSRVKGGRLARGRAGVLTLLVSDVVDGAPHDVGSGPTVPDPTTISEARAVLERAGMAAPRSLVESVKPGDIRARIRVLADPRALAEAVAAALARRGLRVVTDTSDEGDARSIADRRVARALALGAGEAAVIACEPTVRLPSKRGRGGRAGWVALAAMGRLPAGVALLCAASDGVDGSSGSAGALVTRPDAERAGRSTIDAALAAFDDATVHEALGTRLPGGPTGHNLADVHVVARVA